MQKKKRYGQMRFCLARLLSFAPKQCNPDNNRNPAKRTTILVKHANTMAAQSSECPRGR